MTLFPGTPVQEPSQPLFPGTPVDDPESPSLLATTWRGAKNAASGAVTGVANLLGGAAAWAASPFSTPLSQRIKGNLQQANTDFNSDIGADQGPGIMKSIGGAAPYIAGAVVAPEVELPEALANIPPYLRTALNMGKSAAINGTVGAAANEGAGGDPTTGFETGAMLGAGSILAGKVMGSILPKAGSLVSKPDATTYSFAASPGGLAKLQGAAISAPDKVNQLVGIANNPAPYMKDAEAAVRGPESNAAPVDIRPTLRAFDNVKFSPNDFGGNTSQLEAANAAIQKEKLAIGGNLYDSKGNLSPPTDVNRQANYTLPATQFRQLKTSIGNGIPWDSPEAPAVKNALKNVYAQMNQSLTDAVSKTQGADAAAQYKDALTDLSQKIGDFQELQGRLGSVPSKQLNSADALIQGYGKQGNWDLLNRIDNQTGSDFSSHAQLRNMASQLGMKSQPTIAPEERSSAPLSYLPPHLNLTKIGIPAIADRVGGPVAEGAAAGLESPGTVVRATQLANKFGRGGIVLPPYLQAALQAQGAQ